jgi:hypothetical protein
MERAKEYRSTEKVIDQTELADEILDEVSGGVTLPVKRLPPDPPKSPQPRTYWA